MFNKKTLYIGLSMNKILIILLTGFLLLFFLIKNYQTPCFSPLELLTTYFILLYNILNEIFIILITH